MKQFLRNSSFILFGLIILVLPLLFSQSHGFEYPKVFVFRILTLIVSAVFIIDWFKDGEELKLRIYDWLGILWVIFTAGSSIFAGNFQNSFFGGAYRFQGVLTQATLILLFIVSMQLFRKYFKLKKAVLSFIIAAGLIQSAILVWQWVSIYLFGVDIPAYSGRVVGTLGQPNFAAGAVLISFAISLGLTKKHNKLKFIILFLFFGIFLTGSWAEIAVAVVISFLLIWVQLKSYFVKAALICFLLAFLSALTLYGFKKESQRLNFIQNPVESRLSIWPASLELFLKRPLVGYGAENLQFIFPDEFGGASVDRAHNALLDTLLVGGIFLGGVYVLLVYFGLNLSWQTKNYALFFGLLASILRETVGVSSIVNLILFWTILSLIFSAGRKFRHRISEESPKE